ncbi:NAD(P)/FAD-dependent oxidoreductase [Nonomuraea aurantiaca]|uniref:NAD(P)/FAD-dependent oxidoreductase n=1 Tax=Nonomuraea aurantiaca TaxID=2878562 RepID=UPI001CDA1BC4|nr:FAD-dependent oxidoreductase [Nonomuraea aurantiaca]MCA2223870.1 FAD-binding oxidoreductase [Nonomuraea aurantiaca]
MRVAVIGSGIVGAAAAWHLSGRGVSVTVVDGAFTGRATEAGAGIVCPWVDHTDDDAWYALAREGARSYPDLVSALGEDIGYARVGALLVAPDPVELEPVRALLQRRRPEAPEMGDITEIVAPSALFPPLREGLSAIHVPGAARVDGRAVRDALLRAAVRQGADLRTGTAALTPDGGLLLRTTPGAPGPEPTTEPQFGESGIPSDRLRSPGDGAGVPSNRLKSPDDGVGGPSDRPKSPARMPSERPKSPAEGAAMPGDRLKPSAEGPGVPSERVRGPVEEAGVRVAADVVIVAAGAWSGEVCRGLGVEIPVFPRRGQIVHAALDGVDTASWPIVLPRSGPYLLGFPGSRLVVGATVEDAGFSPYVTVGGVHEVLAAGLRLAPGLDGARVVETRVGLRPVYAAGTALIDRLTERVVVATGLSAYGLTAGPFTGRLAAALALGETPPIDISPYAYVPA